MPKFIETLRPTNFGFFDSDNLFQSEADSMVTFVLRTLGDDVLNVECTKKMIWGNMETSAMMLTSLLSEYYAKSNLASILGMPTGSVNTDTGLPTINLSNMYVQQNLQFLDDLSAPYAAMIGYGQASESISGSILLRSGVQDYDLYTELVNRDSGTPLYNLQPSGSFSRLTVYEVFHDAPVQYVFNSNLASNFVASGMPVESYIPDTRFYVLPLFEDVLRSDMLETASKLRKSHYSYRVTGRQLRLYPIPTNIIPGLNDRLWVRIGYKQQPLPTLASTLVASGTLGGPTGAGSGANFLDQKIYGVNSPFSAPYGPIQYKSLNIWARNWIAQYTLALSTEQLGRIRSKFKSFPIPGGDVSLNGDDLVTQGREDKDKLITSLREVLESLTFDKIQERETQKSENLSKQLALIPTPPRYAIRYF